MIAIVSRATTKLSLIVVPEVGVVEDVAVVRVGAALRRLVVPEAEEERRSEGDQEVRGPEEEPDDGRGGDPAAGRHFIHLDETLCNGM